ncbi:MAG: hypothetical protein KAT17_00870 [Candidatus Aminicenantes bacterium]|nr:hypothetical protein [Candidatus Aminicenantes bacterium]
MFRVLIWGESVIILGIAALAYIGIKDSEKLKNSFIGKFIVISMICLSIAVFLFSFDCIRYFFSRIFL